MYNARTKVNRGRNMDIENAYITLPKGFIANGVHAGLKPNGNPDLAYIGSDRPTQISLRVIP